MMNRIATISILLLLFRSFVSLPPLYDYIAANYPADSHIFLWEALSLNARNISKARMLMTSFIIVSCRLMATSLEVVHEHWHERIYDRPPGGAMMAALHFAERW